MRQVGRCVVGVAGRITGQDKRPKSEGGSVGQPGRNYLLFLGRVLGHGSTYKEGTREKRWRQGNLPISPRGRVAVFYHDPPPRFQVLTDAQAERGELPSARL